MIDADDLKAALMLYAEDLSATEAGTMIVDAANAHLADLTYGPLAGLFPVVDPPTPRWKRTVAYTAALVVFAVIVFAAQFLGAKYRHEYVIYPDCPPPAVHQTTIPGETA